MKKCSRVALGAAVGTLMTFGGSQSAFADDSLSKAQPDSDHDADIIVTARRRDENLQRVPVAVSVVSGDAFEKAGAITVQDVTHLAPSVSIGGSSRGGSVPSLSIRGLASADSSGASDATIGIYVNDVILNRPNGVLTALYDVNSVQVLRGPQGTLFGRNTIGGAILINTNQPVDHLDFSAKGTIGNYKYRSGEAMLNVPLTDWASLRVAGRIDRREGYVTSVTTGQRQSDLHNEGFRASLKLEQGPVKNTFIASWYKADTNGAGGTTPGLMPAGSFTGGGTINANNNVPTVTLPDGRTFQQAIADAGATRELNFYDTAANVLQFEHTKYYDFTNTTEINASDALQFKNIIAYRNTRSNALVDLDGSAVPLVQNNSDNKFEQFSEEFQTNITTSRFNGILGLYYFKETGTDFSNTLSFTGTSLAHNGGFVRNISYSAFASGTYDITSNLKVDAGIRYTVDKRYIDLQSGTYTNLAATPVFACTLGQVTSITSGPGPSGTPVDYYTATTLPPDQCHVGRSIEFKEPTWSLGLNWQATPDVLAYVAHRHGYHSGQLNSRAVFYVPSDVAKPEFLDDVELGLKSRTNFGTMPVRFNLAAYYGWYKDVQRTISLPIIYYNGLTRNLNTLQNASQAHIYGIEAEFDIRPIEHLSINGFAAFNRTKYDDYLDTATNPPLDRSNDLFPYAPKFTAGATARYELPIGGDSLASLQVNYFHTSSFNTVTNLQPLYSVLPAYDLVNLRAEISNIANSGFNTAIFVNNALKEKYFTGASVVPQLGVSTQYVGAPRLFGLELSYQFNR